jgi:ABC-2 type transport system ATP-binding protein
MNIVMDAVHISGFTKTYDKTIHAVQGLDLSIKQGEFFGLLGPNGAGKSTTIKCMTGISKPSGGTIEIYGKNVVEDYRESRLLVGLCPQEFNVDIFATPEKILYFMAGFYGVPRKDRMARVNAMIKRFELEPHRTKKFKQLSGGLKRRVMLARAMIHDPKLLILDEPTAGVDVELRRELWEYLKELNQAGKTIILTSHYLEEVEQLCNRIGMINQGKLVAIGDKSAFIKEGSNLEQTYLDMIAENNAKK